MRLERMRDAVDRACPDPTSCCRAASTRSPTPHFGEGRECTEPRWSSSDVHRDESADHPTSLLVGCVPGSLRSGHFGGAATGTC